MKIWREIEWRYEGELDDDLKKNFMGIRRECEED